MRARPWPFAAAGDSNAPVTAKTAVLMTIRNEDPARAFARIAAVKDNIDATGQGGAFAYFVLSDTSDAAIARAEEQAFAAWRARAGAPAEKLFYRRRASNEGFKAGNLRDFCVRWGGDYDFMLPLDADSLMDGETILRMVRIGQEYPGARNPAKPRRRRAEPVGVRAFSSSVCGTECAPIRWAARGGRAIAGRSGAIMRSCASPRSRRIAGCRFCLAARRSAARSCRTIRWKPC